MLADGYSLASPVLARFPLCEGSVEPPFNRAQKTV
jgi:hypothetical protein